MEAHRFKQEKKMNKWWNIRMEYVCFAMLSIFMVVVFATFGPLLDDELEAVHSAWKVSQGEVPYKDFFQHHHPLLYYLLAPLIAYAGDTIAAVFVCRAFMIITGLAICWLTYLLTREVYQDKQVAVVSVGILTTSILFSWNGFQIRPDVPMTLFILMAIYFLLRALREMKVEWFILCAVAFGISFLFLQKAIIAIGLGLCVVMRGFAKNKVAGRHIAWFFTGFIVTVLPYYGYLWMLDLMHLYIQLNWVLNSQLISQPVAVGFGQMIAVSAFGLLWYGMGIYLGREVEDQFLLVIFSIGLGLSIFLYPVPNPHYWLPFYPLASSIGAYAVVSMAKRSVFLVRIFLIVALVIVGVKYLHIYVSFPLAEQVHAIRYVLNATSPEDVVLEGHQVRANLFRKDADYFWFQTNPKVGALVVYQRMSGYQYDPYEILKLKEPKLISIDAFDNIDDSRITDFYRPSEVNGLWLRKK